MRNKNNIDFFDGEIVRNFDEDQKGLMPGHDLIFQAMEDILAIHFKEDETVKGKILDVGAGTGNESMRILQLVEKKDEKSEPKTKFKNMQILAIDSSKNMKKAFVDKFKKIFPDKKFNEEYYLNYDITSLPEDFIEKNRNKCKIALSGYTIHHFHTDEKREIYQTMYDFLEPGGLLLNIDLFTYESKTIREAAHNFDLDYIKNNIENNDIKQKWLNHYNNETENESHNALDPVEVQIDILKEIGFVDVECVFRYWQQGIIRATKPTKDEKPEEHSLFYLEKSIKIKKAITEEKKEKEEIKLQDIDEINADFKEKLKNELGVVAVGVSILSKADEDIRFLIDSKVPNINALGAKINNKHNFSISHSGFGEYDDFINFLYYIGRGSSIKYPEYLNRIQEKEQNIFENKIQKNARDKYETLHISAGEIMLFTVIWRFIIRKILTNDIIDKLVVFFEGRSSIYNNPFGIENNEYHLIEKLQELREQKERNDEENKILDGWNNFLSLLKRGESIDIEFELNNNRNREALEEYARFLFKDNALSINGNLEDFIATIIDVFGKKIEFEDSPLSNPKEFLIKLHEKARVPIMPFYFLMLGDEEKELKEQIVFPLLHTFSRENTMYPYKNDSGEEKQESAVIHALWVVKPIKKINHTSDQPWYSGKFSFTSYIKVLHDISQSVCAPIIDEYFEKEHKKNIDAINVHATRAAVSQVMARDMSHNIGSHVLSKMVGIKEAEEKFPFKRQYYSSFDYIYSKILPSKPNGVAFDEKDFNLANFNSYLRTRMDYLADIATGEPSMETTCLLIKDVIGEMDKNRILLNNISGVESFPFTIKVKDCRNCKNENCANDTCFCTWENKKDIPVSIPNGIMGYHALFVIIENLIRNSAKHQGSLLNNSKMIKFILEIRNSKDDETLYEVLIYDSIKISEEKILNEDEKKYFEEETKNEYNGTINNKLDWLVFEQNTRINRSVINPKTNRLREGAWGLIEMDASAAYLRKLAAEKIDDNVYNINLIDTESRYNPDGGADLNILKAVNKNGHLGYRFHMLKPKELLVVDEIGDTYMRLKDDNKLSILRENGIWVLHTQNNSDDYFDIEKVYAHPFMLVLAGGDFDVNNYLYVKTEDGKSIDTKGLLRGNLPFRIIVCKKELNGKEESSPWVAYIDRKHELITNLISADKLIREEIKEKEDLKKNTLMDWVWQAWLENKMKFYKVREINRNAFKLLIPFNDSGTDDIEIHFALHGKESDYNDYIENTDSILFFSSSVKDFVDTATVDEDQGEVNTKFDKYKTSVLADSFLSNILIVDERVQSSWETQYSSFNIVKREIFSAIGMYSPNEKKDKLNLNASVYDANYKKNIEALIDLIDCKSKKIKGLDFIVIHLGVIEKILTANGVTKKEDDVKRFILELQNRLAFKTRIIITSGRGKPDNLPNEVPFISFSTISQYSIETPFKPFLNQIIQSARIFKHI